VSLDVHPVEVAGGRLCIGHRPGKRSLPELREVGVTHVVTLLGPSEGAEDLIRRVEGSGLQTRWLPLAGAQPVEDPDQLTAIVSCFAEIASLLEQGRTVFIHCSAGIHRTGMVAHALLRYLGVPSDEARELLGRMRPVTLAGVTDQRLDWGERFARPVMSPDG
jgi:hypothetical protein